VAWPKEGFEDLFRDDFIRAAGQVLRRKLDRITTHWGQVLQDIMGEES